MTKTKHKNAPAPVPEPPPVNVTEPVPHGDDADIVGGVDDGPVDDGTSPDVAGEQPDDADTPDNTGGTAVDGDEQDNQAGDDGAGDIGEADGIDAPAAQPTDYNPPPVLPAGYETSEGLRLRLLAENEARQKKKKAAK